MKRLFLAALTIFCFTGVSNAVESVWLSSTTATSDKDKMLCGGNSRGILYKVIVSSKISTGEPLVSVYNSSWTTTNKTFIGPIDLRSLGSYEYNAGFPQGMLYTSTGTATISILYKCY